jgi:hypothetical protein
VTDPDRVTWRGWHWGWGSRRRPAVPLGLDVHPWFLADAIGWYVQHPQERPGIGTPEGYRRLQAALAGAPSPS